MFCLPNLSASNVTQLDPWTFTGQVPKEVRGDKKARAAWATNIALRWNMYSAFEGQNNSGRINKENPPHSLHGFIADFDEQVPDEEVLRRLERFAYGPSWMERTLSGNVRLIWPFEKPLLLPSRRWTQFFLEKVLEDFPVDTLLFGFDQGAWLNPERYYTNSTKWINFNEGKPISADRVRGWCVRVSAKYEWCKELDAVQIPPEVLRPALEKKFPRFSEWPNDFALGAQGPSFWVEGSLSPTSAIVRETGMQTFANHALQGFASWKDLLGTAFVRDYEVDAVGKAVAGIYFDGRYYWRQIPSGEWKAFDKADISIFLRKYRGVSIKTDKDGISELTTALAYIQSYQNVAGAGPFVFRPSGLIIVNDRPVLNTNNRHVVAPASEWTPWGPTGKFDFLSRVLEFWDPLEQLDYFLSWHHTFYKSGYLQQPCSGHHIFIAGPTGVGKGFLSHAIVGASVGGSAEAESFLLGTDGFSSDLFAAPHWFVDDAVFTTANDTLRRFAEAIKKMAANRNFRSNEKFKVATPVNWQGRLIITCNPDPESIRAIPDLTGSIEDKISIFRTAKEATVHFPPQAELEALVARQLPYYLRWLLDYKIPDHCRTTDQRFGGIRSYIEPSLRRTAEQSSLTSAFWEIIELWKPLYREETHKEMWEGTSLELHRALSSVIHSWAVLKNFPHGTISRQLSTLQSKGAHGIECDEGLNGSPRRWKILLK